MELFLNAESTFWAPGLRPAECKVSVGRSASIWDFTPNLAREVSLDQFS